MPEEIRTRNDQRKPLLLAEGLSKLYVQHRWLSRTKFFVQALDRVELALPAGVTFGLVGESGSGKSTLARCLARLEEPTCGTLWFDGTNLCALKGRELLPFRAQVQLVFQDAARAFNPQFSAAEIIMEPLVIQGRGTPRQRHQEALELMEQVGLCPGWASRLPLEFSGGQKQRLAIARALVLEPRLLIFDEALSGLDLSLQARILELLLKLKKSRGLTYLFISHDLALVQSIADEVAVMHQGRIVERATTQEAFANPIHPQTRALLASVLELDCEAVVPPEGSGAWRATS